MADQPVKLPIADWATRMNAFLAATLEAIGNQWARPAQVFGIVLAALAVRYLVKLAFDRLARRLERTATLYDDAVLEAARKPIGWSIWIFGTLLAAQVTGQGSRAQLFEHIGALRDLAAIVLLAWFAVRFVRFVETHVGDPRYRKRPVDPSTAAVVGKLLRASVLITAMLLSLQAVGVSISGVLAFGGLGGLAVGFAARDLLANFFGALLIFLDRPFAVGDWIRSPDREIEGTVEEIGWRVTRVRTFDQRPLYVPNSVFSSITVENPSRMTNRRIYEVIGLRYDDLAVLPTILEDIRRMLIEHEAIDTTRTLMVNFLHFGPSSVDVMVYTFTKTTVWTEFHAIKEDVLLRIAAIVRQHGAQTAFPTRTVHLRTPADAPPVPGPPPVASSVRN